MFDVFDIIIGMAICINDIILDISIDIILYSITDMIDNMTYIIICINDIVYITV